MIALATPTAPRTVHRIAIAAALVAAFQGAPAWAQSATAAVPGVAPAATAAAGTKAAAAVQAAPTRAPGARAGAPATAAAPAAPVPDAGPSCVGGLPEPMRVRLHAGKSTFVNAPEPIVRRSVGDPEVVDGRMVTPQVLHLVAGRIGATNAILQGESGRCLVIDVTVAIDTEAVQTKLAELLPGEKGIRVSAAADSLVLAGTVTDAMAADRAVAIANAYVRTAYQQGLARDGAAAALTARNALAPAEHGGAPQLARIVNLLSVGSAQQVMLEVKVAEVSKTLLDKLGASFAGTRTNGSWTYRLLTNFLLEDTAGGIVGAAKAGGLNGFAIEAEKRDGLVRVLAEPNVMAISGQEGSFLAGGKILIPVSQNNLSGALTITLEEKEFGVGLKFTPTVLSDGLINLKVQPEVSELSREGVGISTSAVAGRAIFPLITTRRAATTIQLADGQSFAIGGLIKNSSAANLKGLPILGELPILGALFRSADFQSEKTELVFVVTPRLVKPLPPEHRLPTDAVGEPTRQGVFLGGRLDSPPPARAPESMPAAPKAGGLELK